MKFNVIEIVNVLIVIILLNIIMRRRDVTTLLLVLFVYGTLHFGFASIALATNESASLLAALHTEGGGVLAKLSTLTLLGVAFLLLIGQASGTLPQCQRSEKKVAFHILLAMGILLCGYILNFRQGDWLQLKNIISIEALLALLMIGFLSATGVRNLNAEKIFSWSLGGLIILGATDCIAIYEVITQHSWASTLESSGARVYRASSILFNPNLLAFWASLVYLGCAYGMHERKDQRKLMLWGMIFAAVAIYFSGSRSIGYLLLSVLFVVPLLIKQSLRWVPLLILPLTMLTIYAGAEWIMSPIFSNSAGWREIALLGERFAEAPFYLANYMLGFAGVPFEVRLSIEGRFIGDGRDAGWMVLYQDAGWLGTAAIMWICLISLLWGVRTYLAERSAASVYALATLCCCLMTGFVMRFQIFPVWLFMGVVFIPCLVFWARTVNSIPLPIGNHAHINS